MTVLIVRRLIATLLVAGIGLLSALGADTQGWDRSSGYFLLATILLAIGLFSSTYGIRIEDIKGNVRLILVAVTLGVLAKAALIGGVMYLVFRDPMYIVLAVAVAQIDPLSVAVMRERIRLSARAKAILSAWSSFDDPVTVILAIYLSAVALNLNSANPAFETPEAASILSQLSTFGSGLLSNIVLVVVAAVVWLSLSWIGKRRGCSITDGSEQKLRSVQVVAILALAVAAAIAVDSFLMLGLAVIGLFFRPGIGRFVSAITPVAFLFSTLVLGLILVDGVRFFPGLILGGAAFGAQVVVGLLLTRSLPFSDRARLALSQQSGITAVILALLLETAFPGTVAIVAPAILVVNTLHLISNALYDKAEERRNANSVERTPFSFATAYTPQHTWPSTTEEQNGEPDDMAAAPRPTLPRKT